MDFYDVLLAKKLDGGGGGGEAVLIDKSISANGTYNASSDNADGYKKVVVNVPNPSTGTIQITQNGTVNVTNYANAEVNVPTGALEVATGTFTGNGSNYITFAIGKKMPYTDLVFYWWANNETEYAYDSNYKYATGVITMLKQFNQYDLSTDGSHGPSYNMAMKVNNSGTITNVSLTSNFVVASTVRNNSYGNTTIIQTQDCIKSSEGFSIKLSIGNSSYKYVNGLVYNWKLLYIGNDPGNDIIEVA